MQETGFKVWRAWLGGGGSDVTGGGTKRRHYRTHSPQTKGTTRLDGVKTRWFSALRYQVSGASGWAWLSPEGGVQGGKRGGGSEQGEALDNGGVILKAEEEEEEAGVHWHH